MNQYPLTNLTTRYEPHDSTGQMQVCVRIPFASWSGGIESHCVNVTDSTPAGLHRYLPSECAVMCNGSSGQYTHTSSNRCIRNPDAMSTDGAVFSSESECEDYPQAYYLS